MSGGNRWRWLTRLWPKSLAGRLIAALLLAIVAAQLLAFYILVEERQEAIRRVNEEQVLQRTVALVLLLRDSPPALHDRLVSAASLRRQTFWLDDRPTLRRSGELPLDRAFANRLKAELGEAVTDVRVHSKLPHPDGPWGHDDDDDDDDDDREHWRPWPPPNAPHSHRDGFRKGPWHGPVFVAASLQLTDGRWLNARTDWILRRPRWTYGALISLGAMVFAVVVVVIFVVRRITRPMNRLAEAADDLGRGQASGPLPEEGPEELRSTTRAFNRMQERLDRFIRDRTHLLAAISHDLRTPITSLRLRAEFIDDAEVRGKVLETLDEMQRMTEETLDFAREDAAREDTQTVDLAALVGSLCEDLADMGLDVEWREAPRCPLPCRPTALKRALRNLIENAVTYGNRAEVSLGASASELTITIEDQGPGIPEQDFERVFEPFARLEESRNRETGGVGLGLAIARSIVRAHGGEIVLANRAEGGLRVTVTLPTGR